jgi:hypothetical protein
MTKAALLKEVNKLISEYDKVSKMLKDGGDIDVVGPLLKRLDKQKETLYARLERLKAK